MSQKDVMLAYTLADKFHGDQKYGDKPYVYHLEMVRGSVIADEARCVALYTASGSKAEFPEWRTYIEVVALLHDFLEDTPADSVILDYLFPDWVVDAIVALTKHPNEPAELYMLQVKKDPVARFVKLHDAKCNMEECMKRGDNKRAAKYARKMADLMEGE